MTQLHSPRPGHWITCFGPLRSLSRPRGVPSRLCPASVARCARWHVAGASGGDVGRLVDQPPSLCTWPGESAVSGDAKVSVYSLSRFSRTSLDWVREVMPNRYSIFGQFGPSFTCSLDFSCHGLSELGGGEPHPDASFLETQPRSQEARVRWRHTFARPRARMAAEWMSSSASRVASWGSSEVPQMVNSRLQEILYISRTP